MKKELFIIFLLLSQLIWGQSNIEQWRKNAYAAKIAGDQQKSIELYSKILKLQPGDYDARLAIARLYFSIEKYQKSISFYNKIYQNDPTDVEALKGLGDNYLYLDKIDKAVTYYQKALSYLPNHVPVLFRLAKAYSWQGKLDKAIQTYQKVLKIDPTYAEAYQGIGKMYYWQEQPNTALKYYQKALALDPNETVLLKEYLNIKRETALRISTTSKYINENEQNYKIDAFIEQIEVHKRMLDHLDLSFNILADHSNKNYTTTTVGDTTRWYNTAWLKAGWLTNHHQLYIYSGYSASDQKLSSYGLNWQWKFPYKSLQISNNFTAGYDYFYYWNQVGKVAVSNTTGIKYNRIKWRLGLQAGIVDKAYILDVKNDRYEEDENIFMGFSTSLNYQVLRMPKTNIGINYSYLNHDYKSTQYYSPQGRNLYGPSLSIYYPFSQFYFYGDTSFNLGEEFYYENTPGRLKSVQKKYINADNLSANIELGYQHNAFSSSISLGHFYNEYYQNLSVSFNLKYFF